MSNNRSVNNTWYYLLNPKKNTPENLELMELALKVQGHRCRDCIKPPVLYALFLAYEQEFNQTEFSAKREALYSMLKMLNQWEQIK